MITLTGVEPAAGSKRNSRDCLVEFALSDDGVGINSSTLIVELSGVRAVEGAIFLPGFNGAYSELLPDVGLLGVIIDREIDFLQDSIVEIKIQIQDLDGKYYNFDYSIKIVSHKPYIFSSSPANKDVLVTPQKLYFDIRDDIDVIDASSLRVTLNKSVVYATGGFLHPFVGSDSAVVNSGGTIQITIDPEEFIRDGDYIIRVEASDSVGNKLNQEIQFSVRYTGVVLPAVFPQGGFIGFYQGVKKVIDVGNGSDITLEWGQLASRYYSSDINALVYYSADRLAVFDGQPKYLVDPDITGITIDGFEIGTGYYFAVRAMESYKATINTSGMIESQTGVFAIPDATELVSVLTADGAIIEALSVNGYPEEGFLIIGVEVVRYNAIDRVNGRFMIPASGRGLNNTTAVYHDIGEVASLFLLCQDDNNVIVYGTASFQELDLATGRQANSIGIIVPDFSDFERMEHDGLDHCGYHQPLPWEILNNKNDCGSYLGGEYNGFRGLDIFQRAMDREEELMENVGEKCILFRRKWAGETCSCVTFRRQHPKVRSCRFCYGTGFVNGYDQILNLRRQDKRVMIRFYEAPEDLKLGDHNHLGQDFQPSGLALFKPIVKDRDLVVRFDFTGDIEYIYEILNVNRERFVFNKYGRQKLTMIRLDKTDILYQIPYEA